MSVKLVESFLQSLYFSSHVLFEKRMHLLNFLTFFYLADLHMNCQPVENEVPNGNISISDTSGN